MDFDKTLRNLIIVILLCVIFFFGISKCENTVPKVDNIEHYSDTTYVTHIDTIEFEKIVTRTKMVYDTALIYMQTDGTVVKQFLTRIDDSLIEGTVNTAILIDDTLVTLLDQSIDYIAKFPKYIIKSDSVFIHDSTVVTLLDDKINLMVGANVALGGNNAIVPMIGLQLKNKSLIEIGYDPFNKNFMAGVKFKLKFK